MITLLKSNLTQVPFLKLDFGVPFSSLPISPSFSLPSPLLHRLYREHELWLPHFNQGSLNKSIYQRKLMYGKGFPGLTARDSRDNPFLGCLLPPSTSFFAFITASKTFESLLGTNKDFLSWFQGCFCYSGNK